MSIVKSISDPVGEKKPDKSYAWWIQNIDHKITSEVGHYIPTQGIHNRNS
jgi:hypothetical protein